MFNDSARSGRKASDAVTSICPATILGSGRPVCSGPVDSQGSLRPGVVAGSSTLGARYSARSGVPSARLVVRRLGRGLGCPPGGRSNFRPLVLRRGSAFSQRQRALSGRTYSTLLRSANRGLCGSHFCGQLNSDCLSSQPGGHAISAADSPVGGVSSSGAGSAVHYGSPQCHGGLSIPTQSDLGVGMDSESRGLSRVAEAVASVHRPFCHLTKSPMLPIFSTVPRSECSGHGCSAPELEWVAGVCLSSLVPHSSGSQEAPAVIWSPLDHRSSILASEAMVPGPSGLGSGRSGGASSVAQSSAPTTLPSSSSGSVRAVASCVETIQRFARSQGFSKCVARQSSLARRSSSRAGYQAKWSIYRHWCHMEGHSVSWPSL